VQKFGITIPRAAGLERGTEDIVPHATESASLPSRILVLDDEPVLRALVARILTEAGYQVATLADALTAVEALGGGQYDLLITNSVMRGAGGAKLVASVRERHPRLPILHLDDGGVCRPTSFRGTCRPS
jgi:PleD family two-component response regulator